MQLSRILHIYVHRYTTSFCTAAKEEYAGLVVHLLDPSGGLKGSAGLPRIVCVNVNHEAGVMKSMAHALQFNSEAGSCMPVSWLPCQCPCRRCNTSHLIIMK